MQQYPEKEQRIFEGVLALAEGGADLHLLTVQDIARAAGIGKGTVYEYFTSKEDILAGTILYCIEAELDGAERVMQAETSFDGCLEGVGRLLGEVLEQRLVRYRLMMDSLQRSVSAQPAGKYGQRVQVQCGRLVRMAKRLVELGRAEGRIRPEYTEEYCLFVLRAALHGLVVSCGDPLAVPARPAAAGRALACAAQMLRRALG